MTQLVTRAPPLIPQQLCGIVEAKRSQSLYDESCDRSALMMRRTCCGNKGGARFTNCVNQEEEGAADDKRTSPPKTLLGELSRLPIKIETIIEN
jgi:hypothetical protein